MPTTNVSKADAKGCQLLVLQPKGKADLRQQEGQQVPVRGSYQGTSLVAGRQGAAGSGGCMARQARDGATISRSKAKVQGCLQVAAETFRDCSSLQHLQRNVRKSKECIKGAPVLASSVAPVQLIVQSRGSHVPVALQKGQMVQVGSRIGLPEGPNRVPAQHSRPSRCSIASCWQDVNRVWELVGFEL